MGSLRQVACVVCSRGCHNFQLDRSIPRSNHRLCVAIVITFRTAASSLRHFTRVDASPRTLRYWAQIVRDAVTRCTAAMLDGIDCVRRTIATRQSTEAVRGKGLSTRRRAICAQTRVTSVTLWQCRWRPSRPLQNEASHKQLVAEHVEAELEHETHAQYRRSRDRRCPRAVDSSQINATLPFVPQ